MPESMKDHQERSILVSFIYYVSVCINVNVCVHMSVHMRRDPKRVLGVFYLSLSLPLRQGLFLNPRLKFSWLCWKLRKSQWSPVSLSLRCGLQVFAGRCTCYMSAGFCSYPLSHLSIAMVCFSRAPHIYKHSVLAAMETNRSATPLQLKTPFWELGNPGFKSLLCHKWMVWCLTRSLTHLL